MDLRWRHAALMHHRHCAESLQRLTTKNTSVFFELMGRGEYCHETSPIHLNALLQKSIDIYRMQQTNGQKINTAQELLGKFNKRERIVS